MNSVILLIPNAELLQHITAGAPFLTFNGQQAEIPRDDCEFFKDYMSGMGYKENADFKFEGYDLNNGYGSEQEHDELTGYADRWFPDGETSTPVDPDKLGPSAAKYGNNPIKEHREIYESLLQRFKDFKASR